MKIKMHLLAGLPDQLETAISVAGDTLTVNGVDYDLSSVPDGGYAEPQGEHPFVGVIKRVDGVIEVAVLWSYDPETASTDQGATHPVFEITSGAVPDPVERKPVEEPPVDELAVEEVP